MYESLEFIKDNLDDTDVNKFSQVEYEKFRRVVDYMESTVYSDEQIQQGKSDFYNWFTELDLRRGTDFLATFPEMKNFYKS